jgi:hypothetical protein
MISILKAIDYTIKAGDIVSTSGSTFYAVRCVNENSLCLEHAFLKKDNEYKHIIYIMPKHLFPINMFKKCTDQKKIEHFKAMIEYDFYIKML